MKVVSAFLKLITLLWAPLLVLAAVSYLRFAMAQPTPAPSGTYIKLRDAIRPGLDDDTLGMNPLHVECQEPGGHLTPDQSQCICCPGYHGTGCAVFNRCHNQVCINGGSCNEMTGACDCHEGFVGDHCEIPDCGIHGAFDPFSGQCTCRRGWDGYRCDQCALPNSPDMELVCVPVVHGDYLLLEVEANVAHDLLTGLENPMSQPYNAIRPGPGKGTLGHDGRYYGCDCLPLDYVKQARNAHRDLLKRGISAADLGAFDQVISDCITMSNLTSQQMTELNELWNRCLTQERRGRLNDTWYILGIIFICLTIILIIVVVVTCFLWSYQLDRFRQLGYSVDENADLEQHIGSPATSPSKRRPRQRSKDTSRHRDARPVNSSTTGRHRKPSSVRK